MSDARGAIGAVRSGGLHQPVDGGRETVEQSVAQRADPGDLELAVFGGASRRDRRRHDAGDVLRSRPTLALLTAPQLPRVDRHAIAHDEHSHTLGSAELVGAQAERIDARAHLGDIGPAERLDRVGVQHGSGGQLAHDGCGLGERLDDAGLVVDGHERHDADGFAFPEGLAQGVEVESTAGVDGDDATVDRLDGVEHGVVLDGTAHGEPDTVAQSEHGEVVRLGSSARVDDLAGFASDERCEFLPSLVDGPTCVTGSTMGPRGIGEPVVEERQHGLDRVGMHRSRRGVVEVGRHVRRVPVPVRATAGGTGAGQTRPMAPGEPDPSLYGRSFADVYDDWYADSFDTEATVATVARLAGDGSVLELGAGTGRLALPLATTGLEVVALDASTEMLDRLRTRDADGLVTTVLADMADLDRIDALVGRRFAVVVCACSSMLNLPDAEAITHCLGGAAAMLAPGGVVALEAVVPVDEVPLRSLSPARVNGAGAVFVETRFDPESRRVDGRHIEIADGLVRTRPWSVVLLAPARFDELAAAVGLRLRERWADWSRSPFDDDCGSHVSIYAREP